MAVINDITMLRVVLTGAALIREREHGTVEHLLDRPEIMIAKIWATGLIIIVVAILSLWFVVYGALRVPLPGATLLFIAGSVLYEISLGAHGILLATLRARWAVRFVGGPGSGYSRPAVGQCESPWCRSAAVFFIVSLGNGREHLVGEVV
jgi:hypothetical protein